MSETKNKIDQEKPNQRYKLGKAILFSTIGFFSSLILLTLGFKGYHQIISHKIQDQEIKKKNIDQEEHLLPDALFVLGMKLTTHRDSSDGELFISNISFGKKSIPWSRNIDLDWYSDKPTFITANVDDDPIPELIAVKGSMLSEAYPCERDEVVIFDIEDPEMNIRCDLPYTYRQYLDAAYRQKGPLGTTFKISSVMGIMTFLGYLAYPSKSRHKA